MASKKKNKKKSTNLKKSAGKKSTPARKSAKKPAKKPAKKAKQSKKQAKKRTLPKPAAKKKAAPKKAAAKKPAAKVKATSILPERSADLKGKAAQRRPGRRDEDISSDMLGSDSGGQSGDLQGLTDVEGADSESVDELVEEGNAFEAGIVSGVEDAGRRGDREVHTREVPEDDVPQEYLDED